MYALLSTRMGYFLCLSYLVHLWFSLYKSINCTPFHLSNLFLFMAIYIFSDYNNELHYRLIDELFLTNNVSHFPFILGMNCTPFSFRQPFLMALSFLVYWEIQSTKIMFSIFLIPNITPIQSVIHHGSH